MPTAEDLERPTDAKPVFRLNGASDSLLRALKLDGPPARKTWDGDAIFTATSDNTTFRLKAVRLPEIEAKRSNTSYSRAEMFHHAASQLQTSTDAFRPADSGAIAGVGGRRVATPASPTSEKPQKRSEKYFKLLMKHHERRVDGWADEAEAEARDEAEYSAAYARRRAVEAHRRLASLAEKESRSHLSSDDELEVEEKEPADLPPLVPYDGTMKIELEIVVMPPPDAKEESEGSAATSSRTDSNGDLERLKDDGSSTKSPRMDIREELDRLKEEMGVEDKKNEDEDEDDLPEGLKLKRMANIWDNPKPRWSLGIGGTVFFVPDAERYAHGPSLPPPPPPSLHGRRRVHLKPRLPLDISHNRYRDEHPNIWPDPPYEPGLQDYQRFEEKLLTLDLYRGCSKALATLPQLERAQDESKHRTLFGKTVEAEVKKSQAWKNYNLREKLKRKEAEREAKEAAEKAAAEAKAAALAAAEAEFA